MTTKTENAEFGVFLMAHSPNPILVCRADTAITYVNPAFEKLTGFRAAELIGVNAPYPWWLPEKIEQTHRALQTAMATGVSRIEEHFQKKNGERFWVELTAGLVENGNGTRYYLSNWVDITDRKKAADELRESEERYRSLVDNITTGVTLISPDMKIQAMNRQMRRWYPHIDPSEKPLCYHAYHDPPREDRCTDCPAFASLKDSEVHESTHEVSVHGDLRFHRIVSSPIRNNEGRLVAAINMIEDITAARQTEMRIKSLYQEKKSESKK
ncbi:MAG: PAS domain-containing protein [Desulfobacterales bacterium]